MDNAPVYPWIYTGGVDPYLWEPIPGVQTLNFIPSRVDITPFAGVLSNGQTQTVNVDVFRAFTTAAVALANGAAGIVMVRTVEEEAL